MHKTKIKYLPLMLIADIGATVKKIYDSPDSRTIDERVISNIGDMTPDNLPRARIRKPLLEALLGQHSVLQREGIKRAMLPFLRPNLLEEIIARIKGSDMPYTLTLVGGLVIFVCDGYRMYEQSLRVRVVESERDFGPLALYAVVDNDPRQYFIVSALINDHPYLSGSTAFFLNERYSPTYFARRTPITFERMRPASRIGNHETMQLDNISEIINGIVNTYRGAKGHGIGDTVNELVCKYDKETLNDIADIIENGLSRGEYKLVHAYELLGNRYSKRKIRKIVNIVCDIISKHKVRGLPVIYAILKAVIDRDTTRELGDFGHIVNAIRSNCPPTGPLSVEFYEIANEYYAKIGTEKGYVFIPLPKDVPFDVAKAVIEEASQKKLLYAYRKCSFDKMFPDVPLWTGESSSSESEDL